MKIKFITRLKILLIVSVTLIVNSSMGQSSLPKTWQPDMKLTISVKAMRSATTVISEKESYTSRDDGKKTDYKITKKDLDALMAFLHAKSFDAISFPPNINSVQDGGTENYELTWGNQHVWVSNYSGESTAKNGNFDEVKAYIIRLLDEKKVK